MTPHRLAQITAASTIIDALLYLAIRAVWQWAMKG